MFETQDEIERLGKGIPLPTQTTIVTCVGNKSVTEIIFAVINATNTEHNNTVNQRE